MERWLLDSAIDPNDISFINNFDYDYSSDPTLLGPDDSGWCDAATGCRILTDSLRITFLIQNDKDLLALKLKFNDKIVKVK